MLSYIMAMNLLNMSKEIKKINNTLEYIKNNQHSLESQLNNYDLVTITDEIKNNITDLYSKIEHIYNFNINNKYNYEDKNYNDIYDFLKKINIDEATINKILFLDFSSLNDILLTDDDIFEKNDILSETITFIKNNIQEVLYVTSIDI